MASMVDRVIRAVKMDKEFYNEAERDVSLDQEALQVVIIASVASGIGSFLQGLVTRSGFGIALLTGVLTTIVGIGGYYLWSYLTLLIGTKLFQGDADFGEMKRTLGYAFAPRIVGFLTFIPCIGPLLAFAAGIYSLVLGVIAIREAMDFDTGNAVITTIIGWLIIVVIQVILFVVFLGGAAGAGAIRQGLRGG
jgi:hypothetical protein